MVVAYFGLNFVKMIRSSSPSESQLLSELLVCGMDCFWFPMHCSCKFHQADLSLNEYATSREQDLFSIEIALVVSFELLQPLQNLACTPTQTLIKPGRSRRDWAKIAFLRVY
jgi:hypothetical protein